MSKGEMPAAVLVEVQRTEQWAKRGRELLLQASGEFRAAADSYRLMDCQYSQADWYGAGFLDTAQALNDIADQATNLATEEW